MGIAETHEAKDINSILKTNLKNEKEAIDYYRQMYQTVISNKNELTYEFEKMEHDIRHVIMEEEEHVTELSLLLGI